MDAPEHAALGRWLMRWSMPALAVNVFFVLSGFVITRVLLRDKAEGTPLHYFLLRRSLRILPPYYLCLFGVMVIAACYPRAYPFVFHWSRVVYLYNFTQAWNPKIIGLGPTWTLCVEEQFYLVWPLVVYLFSRHTSWKIMAYLLCPICIVLIIWTQHNPYVLYRMTYTYVVPLGAGALMAYGERWVRSRQAIPLALALFAVGAMIYVGRTPLRPGFHTGYASVYLGSFMLAMGIVLVSLSLIEPLTNTYLRFLRVRVLTELGVMSYGIYLYHPVALVLGVPSFPHGWYTPLIVGAGTLVLAVPSYLLLERPLIQYGARRFRRRQPATRSIPVRLDPARSTTAAAAEPVSVS